MDDAVDHKTGRTPDPDYLCLEFVHYSSDDDCAVDWLLQPQHWPCASCDVDAFPGCFVDDARESHVAHMPAVHGEHCYFDADDCDTCSDGSMLRIDDFDLSRGRDTAAVADCGRANCDRFVERSAVVRLLVDWYAWLGQRSDGLLARYCCRGVFEVIWEMVSEEVVTAKGADRRQSV